MRHDHDPDRRCDNCRDWPQYAIEIALQLQRIENTMATQADIDALDAEVTAFVTSVTADDSTLITATTGIAAEIVALQAANPTIDLTALQGHVTSLGSAVTQLGTDAASVQALVPAATTPAAPVEPAAPAAPVDGSTPAV